MKLAPVDPNEPPPYRRMGKPGEIPPVYQETHTKTETDNAPEAPPVPPGYDEGQVVKKPKESLWKRMWKGELAVAT